METMNYETPVDENNYTARKQNYDRRKEELEYRQKKIKEEREKLDKENRKMTFQIKRLQNKLRLKKAGILRKLLLFIILLIITLVMIFCGFVIYAAVAEESKTTLSQMDEEYNEKVEAYNRLVAQKIAEEEEAEKKLLEKEILDEEADLSSVAESNQNEYIAALNRYPENTIEQHTTASGKDYYLYTEKIDLDEYYITDSGNDVIYPGAIIKGDSLFSNNAYTLISEKRAPVYLTSNHEDGFSVEVQKPDYRTVSDALRSFQSQISSQNAKEWSYETKVITSTEELNATLGIKAGGLDKSIGANLGLNTSEETTTIVVIFTQTYYTISAVPKGNAMDFFEDNINLSDLGLYEPAYVSSVDYGRMITMFVTANMSQQELNAKINGCFQGVEINAGLEKLTKTQGIELSYFFYGGNTSNISTAVDEKEEDKGIIGNIKSFFTGESKESAVNRINSYIDANNELVNPVPISYEIKYLSDNAIVPKMSILRQEIFSAENAKMVHFELDKATDKSFEIDFPEGTLQVDHANFLWNTSIPISLTGSYDGKTFEISLDGSMSGKYSFTLNGQWLSKVNLNISITDVDER